MIRKSKNFKNPLAKKICLNTFLYTICTIENRKKYKRDKIEKIEKKKKNNGRPRQSVSAGGKEDLWHALINKSEPRRSVIGFLATARFGGRAKMASLKCDQVFR